MKNNNYQPAAHYTPDVARMMDDRRIAMILADAYEMGLPEAISLVGRLGPEGLHDDGMHSQLISDVIAWLIKPCRNLPAKILGLACSFEIVDLLNGNRILGIDSMADEARKRGLSRADISHWKRVADKQFSRYGRVFGKSPEACKANRVARLRVLRHGA